MALKTFMVTRAPGQVADGAGGADGAGEPLGPAETTGRGGGMSQMGARTHMSMTYSSRFQQVAAPSSTWGQSPTVRGRQPAAPREFSYCFSVSSGSRSEAQVRSRNRHSLMHQRLPLA